MTILDGILALTIFIVILWMIFLGVASKNPGAMDKIKEFMTNKKDAMVEAPSDLIQQTYQDKRSML